MPVAPINGNAIYYESHGDGPPILLHHRFAQTAEMWAPQVEALAPRYRVVTFDMLGHGRSAVPTAPAAYSVANAVATMAGLLDHLGIERAVVGGLSLGGYLALELAVARPERVRALVLAATGPGYRDAERREKWNRNQLRAVNIIEQAGMESFADSPHAGLDQSMTRERLRAEFDPIGLILTLRHTLQDPGAGHAANLEQPALFNVAIERFLERIL